MPSQLGLLQFCCQFDFQLHQIVNTGVNFFVFVGLLESGQPDLVLLVI